MKWNIQIDKIALKFIAKQPMPQRMRIMAAIAKLPEEGDIKPMAGRILPPARGNLPDHLYGERRNYHGLRDKGRKPGRYLQINKNFLLHSFKIVL